ncbi:MAG: TIGR04372 family glycosyltransferase [Betaproteobacteria bacterium]|nr:TIGR04372 family glycosyltransferase [Betaproteobacteria bacterium]
MITSLQSFWSDFLASMRRHSFARNASVIAAAVLLAPASALLYITRIRFLRIVAISRIGHLAGDVQSFVKSRMLGKTTVDAVLVSPPGAAANECLVDYWHEHVRVVRSPVLARLCTQLARFPWLVHEARVLSFDETAPYIAVQREWGHRPPLLGLTDEHRHRGEEWLSSVGVPHGAPYVCFHSREPGYSPLDEAMHSFRNSNIENYLPAVAELTKRGFWCMRMGDASMRPIPSIDKVVDYARLASRSDWLDVFLSATCRFFVGSCSGLVNLANVFGRPCAVANQAPPSHVLSFGIDDLCIPKLVWSEPENRYLTFAEMFGSAVCNFRLTEMFARQGLRPVENRAEDVHDLALEMLERCEGRATYTAKDEELRRRFDSLMRPGHYSYGGVNRVGRDFLRKYEHLIGDREP